MAHFSPDEIDRIKEEQRLRTSETVKSGIRMYFGFVGKVFKYTCGCMLLTMIIGGLIALGVSWAAQINNRRVSRNMQETQVALAVTHVVDEQARLTDVAEYYLQLTGESSILPLTVNNLPTRTAVPEQLLSPTPQPLPSVTATPNGPFVYVVQSELETTDCLARRFDVDLNSLLAMNILDLNSKLNAGMEILIPAGSSSPFQGERALKPHPDTYTVVSGDTVYSIACSYGDVHPEGIITENGLVQPYLFELGQQLQIP